MIHTVYSNSYEVLRAVLLHNIEALGVEGPVAGDLPEADLFARTFEKVPVIIPNRAVETDVRQAIADRDGVCAGMDFMLLSAWMGFFSKEPMANIVGNEADWMIWRTLREDGPTSFRRQPGHERLAHYLDGKGDEDVWRLARHIAQVFVTYATYRLDWILDWLGLHPSLLSRGPEAAEEKARLEAHPDFLWQRDLWRTLADSDGWRGRRFLDEFPDMLQALAKSAGSRRLTLANGHAVVLPETLHIFVPFVVPPLMLPILKAYAQSGRDIWFYLLNPTSEYWFDLLPRRLFKWGPDADEAATGHPILADNGRSTRANIDRLWRFTAAPDTGLQLCELDVPAPDDGVMTASRDIHRYAGRPQDLRLDPDMSVDNQCYYLESREPALLRRIQDSILKLDPDLTATADGRPLFDEDDASVRFMRAPTATRELEALADWLSARFAADPSLRPDDVLVVTPDLSAAAPLIEKVFGSLPPERAIDWRFAGLTTLDTDRAVPAVLGLAGLLTGRATLEEFEAWVSLPAVAAKFGLSTTDMPVIGAWLRAAGYRYGLSDAHLERIDDRTFAHVKDMSLDRAIERLTLGFCLPGDALMPLGDTLPVRGNESRGWTGVGDSPLLLDALARIGAALEAFRRRIETPAVPAVWTAWLLEAMTTFFADDDDFNRVRQAADSLREDIERAGEGMVVPFGLFMKSLEAVLETMPGGGQPTSRVTFTGMAQLRPLPYRMIAIVGLNQDCAFPGTTRRQEFDLMASAPRRGDRDSRIDNRNVFLDLLLAARERLLISYVCGTGEDADERQPSIVAQELRDWLLSFAVGREERRRVRAMLTQTVPLNAFSEDSFRQAGRGWRSHDAALFEAYRAAVDANFSAPEVPFADAAPEGRRPSVVTLRELADFWKRPATRVLAESGIRLGVELEKETVEMMPSKDSLSAWGRKFDALTAYMKGLSDEDWQRCVEANPAYGARGVREWATTDDASAARELHTKVGAVCEGERLPEADLKIPLGDGWPTLLYRFKGGVRCEGRRRLVLMSVSKASSGSVMKEVLAFVAACAAGAVDEGVLVCAPDSLVKKGRTGGGKGKTKENEPLFEAYELIPFDEEVARCILKAFMKPFLAARENPLQGVDWDGIKKGRDEPDDRTDRLLWRGRDLQAARTKAQTLNGCREALLTMALVGPTAEGVKHWIDEVDDLTGEVPALDKTESVEDDRQMMPEA